MYGLSCLHPEVLLHSMFFGEDSYYSSEIVFSPAAEATAVKIISKSMYSIDFPSFCLVFFYLVLFLSWMERDGLPEGLVCANLLLLSVCVYTQTKFSWF